jgi:hypothetical protein
MDLVLLSRCKHIVTSVHSTFRCLKSKTFRTSKASTLVLLKQVISSVCGLKPLVYAALSYYCMRP